MADEPAEARTDFFTVTFEAIGNASVEDGRVHVSAAGRIKGDDDVPVQIKFAVMRNGQGSEWHIRFTSDMEMDFETLSKEGEILDSTEATALVNASEEMLEKYTEPEDSEE